MDEPAYYTMEVDATVTTLVMGFHGNRRLHEVLVEMAAEMRVEVGQAVPAGLAAVRHLVQKGCLLPSAVPDEVLPTGWR